MRTVVDRFIKYVSFDTKSNPESTTTPSTPSQLAFGDVLVEELKELGLQDIQKDENGYIYATLPANCESDAPVIAFISHMDTSPDFNADHVKPQIIDYQGGDIILNQEKNIVLSPTDFPSLNQYVGQQLITTDGTTLLGADDKAGIEAALQLKEKCPGSTVTVVSMGPPQADVALREALAMGCDDALLISDRAFGGADTWATSSTIAAALKKLDYDVIITGRQAIDGDTAQVGPQIAEHLGIPQVSYVEKMDVEGEDTLVVQRQFEDRHQIIEVKTPCLLTALAELADPRYMSVHGVFDAYREKEVKVWGLEDIKDTVNEGNIGLKGSPTRVKKSFTKQAKGAGTILNDLSDDEAVAAIVEKLQEKHII